MCVHALRTTGTGSEYDLFTWGPRKHRVVWFSNRFRSAMGPDTVNSGNDVVAVVLPTRTHTTYVMRATRLVPPSVRPDFDWRKARPRRLRLVPAFGSERELGWHMSQIEEKKGGSENSRWGSAKYKVKSLTDGPHENLLPTERGLRAIENNKKTTRT